MKTKLSGVYANCTIIFEKDDTGRPYEVNTSEMLKEIHDIVIKDRRMKMRDIAEIVGISTELVHLDSKKFSTIGVLW